MKHLRILTSFWTFGLLAGCATSFTGSAHVEDGRAGCERMCEADGLQMSSLVYMGEYSSACVCQVPGAQTSGDESAAVAGGAAGVVMQMRAAEQQQQSQRGIYP